MSLRARTPVLDECLGSKVYEKGWIWASLMLIGYLWVASYIRLWLVVVLAHHSVCNLQFLIDLASAALLQVWCAQFV